MINMLKKLMSKQKFSAVDFATLKTAMMLAALDGDVSPEELANFREMASGCKGCTPKSFAKLWEEALRSTGYLLVQSKILQKEDLIRLFIAEAEASFVGEVSAEVTAIRERAFEFLAEMAAADGDFSAVERQAIDALKTEVLERRRQMIQTLCPRAVR